MTAAKADVFLRSAQHPKMLLLLALLMVLLPQTTLASCLTSPTDSRLQTFCLVNTFEGQRIDLRTAQVIDYRLKQEGYERGMGLPGVLQQTTFSPYAVPIINYSTDINGGNPDRPLMLGSLTFTGDETLLRKKGVVAGVGVGANGRHIYGEGRYVDFGLGASYAHSLKHDIGIGRAFANFHSKNHIRDHWYLDFYASTNLLWRELTDDTTSTVGASLVKLFATEQGSNHQAAIGIRRLYDDEYEQAQLAGSFHTIHSNGIYSAINANFGASVENTLATKYSISATLGAKLFNKPISATYTYSFADGGKLLNVERNERRQSFTITYTVHPRINITLGYRETDSSIDYFNESGIVIGFQFAALRF